MLRDSLHTPNKPQGTLTSPGAYSSFKTPSYAPGDGEITGPPPVGGDQNNSPLTAVGLFGFSFSKSWEREKDGRNAWDGKQSSGKVLATPANNNLTSPFCSGGLKLPRKTHLHSTRAKEPQVQRIPSRWRPNLVAQLSPLQKNQKNALNKNTKTVHFTGKNGVYVPLIHFPSKDPSIARHPPEARILCPEAVRP